MQKTICFILLILLGGKNLFAQDASKDFETKSVSIFKNGSAFFLKSGEIDTKDGQYRITENIPSALFGTFWIQVSNDQLQSISSFNDQIVETTKTRTTDFAQMLSANLGRKVKLYLGKDEIVTGTVEEVEMIKDPKAAAQPIFIVTKLVTIKSDSSWLSFHSSEIRRLEFLEKPKQMLEGPKVTNKPVLQIDFTSKKKQQNVDMMYLQNGLSWTPSYLIELIDDKKAQLTLRAEVINNAEDINNTDINFVVGVPNFKFANRLSSLVDFYASFVPSINAGFSNALSTQLSNAYTTQESATFRQPVPQQTLANQVTGSAEEDLFFYNLKDFSLRKGGRGHYPIFKEQIDIAHIYESNLSSNNANQRNYQTSFLFTPNQQNKVFHTIKVNNNSNFPWTTGVAMVVKGLETPKPISQDQLNYTPIKGHSFVKLTEAPDIKIKHAEKEVDRKNRAMENPQSRGYFLDLVTVEGQIKIKNYKAKDIDLNVRRTITGQLLNSSTEWLISKQVQRTNQNEISNVCWETSIKSGEELVITYRYQVYVPD